MNERSWTQYVDYTEPAVTPNVTVFDPEPVSTGVLNEDGKPIYRAPEPIGFLKFRQQ